MNKRFLLTKMMIRNNVFLFSITMFFFIECSKKDHKESHISTSHDKSLILKINYDEIKPIKASRIFSEIKYLKLSKPNNNLLAFIDKIIIQGGKIFILDQEMSKTVFIYDLEGNFINSINKRGNGSGEYRFPSDFQVGKKSNIVEILDTRARILSYTIDGNFVETLKLKFNTFKFIKTKNEDSYLFYTPESSNVRYGINLSCKLIRYSKSDNLKTCLLDTVHNSLPFFEERNIFAADEQGNIIFSHTFNDTIYMYRNDTLFKYLIFDFGHKKFPEDFFKRKFSNALERIKAFSKTEGAYHEPNLFMNNNLLYTKFRYTKYNEVFFFRKSKDLLVTNQIINDIDLGLSEFTFIGFSNNKLIASIEAYRIIDRYKIIMNNDKLKNLKNDKLDKFKKFAKNLSINDPPVLMFCKLKDKYE